MRGVLVSADQVPESTPSFASFMVAGLIQHQLNWRLNNETIIEYVRERDFPKRISRLRGIYFFENKYLAQRPIDEEWGGHFKPENLVELELYPNEPITRVDANWITYAPRLSNDRLDTSDLSWIARYWDGQSYSDKPTWELITSGEATVLTTSARAKAYEVVKLAFPESWEFIEMSRLAGEAGSYGGLVTPFIRRLPSDSFSLDYAFLESPFRDASLVEKITKHPDWGRLARYAQANIEKDLIVPNFLPWSQQFTVGVQETGALNLAIKSIHHSA
jgi:hypothetical protein